MKRDVLSVRTVTTEICNSSNKRLCLSTLRALERCFECDEYDKCESKIVNDEYERLIEERIALRSEYIININKIDEAIELL